MHLRIRRRRERLSLTGSELARRAGISPTYVSLIEKGAKIPNEDVAVRIALVLEDDPEIYRAWAVATRYGSIRKTITSSDWLRQVRSDPESWRKLAQGEEMLDSSPGVLAPRSADEEAEFDVDLGGLEALPRASWALRSVKPRPSLDMVASFPSARLEESPPSLEIPLYPEGADPDQSSPAGPPLILDRRLLPQGVEAGSLFAYRVTGDTVRVATITDGSYVVVHRAAGRVTPEGLYAVRLHGRVVLARVLLSRRSLLVLPPEGKTKYDVIELESSGGAEAYLVGRVVAVVGGLA
jgi:transcriptional regulator with XRE-family HTH domain